MRRLAIVEYLMSAGGVARVLRELARALLEVPEARGWDVTLLLSRYDTAHRRVEWPPELTGPRLRVEWLGDQSFASRLLDPIAHAQGVFGIPFSGAAGPLAGRLLRSHGPPAWRAWLGDPFQLIARASRRFDLLYFTYPFWMDVPDVAVPVVTTPQDFAFKHFLPEGSRGRRLQERTTRAWVERSDLLLLSSEAVMEELLRYYPEHAARARVVRLGVDVGRPAPSAAESEAVRVRLGLPRRFLLVTGWVIEHKNQLAVVEALARLRGVGVPVPAVFVGPNAGQIDRPAGEALGAYAARVRAALRRSGLVAGRDYFVPGHVSDADLQALFRLATAFVLPSLYEGFGLPSLEALRAGCPTIVSSIPPLEEQNRLLGGMLRTFDPRDPAALADQVAWVLDHPEEARAAARLGGERVAEVYDWRRTARTYLAAFEEVLAARERRGSSSADEPAS
jgi:glycosyltransferase involved in cell wall biosynthesis